MGGGRWGFHVDEFSRRFDCQLLKVDDLTSRRNDC